MAFSSSQVDENEVIGSTNSRPNIFHRKYSTTSSLYVNATLACPASRQQLLSIACIIQSQITTSVCFPESEKLLPSPNFELSPSEDMALTFEYEKVEEFEFDMGRAISEGTLLNSFHAMHITMMIMVMTLLSHSLICYIFFLCIFLISYGPDGRGGEERGSRERTSINGDIFIS